MYSYARVFPLPVTASTTTSEFFMNMGMAACCTGVVFTKPMESTASRIHSDKDGVKAPKVRSILGWGAIIEFKIGKVSFGATGELRCSQGKVGRTLKLKWISAPPPAPHGSRRSTSNGASTHDVNCQRSVSFYVDYQI